MVKFKKGRLLWLSGILILAVALLGLYNLGEYTSDGIFDLEAAIRTVALFVLMSAALITEIKLPKLADGIVAGVIFVLGPWLAFETVKLIVGVQRYESSIYWLNLLFYAVLQALAFLLTQSARVSVGITVGVACILNLIDEVVLAIRGTPLTPTDLYAISTAMKVTTSSDWHFSPNMIMGVCASIMLIAFSANFKVGYPKRWLRPCAALLSAAVLTVGCAGIYNIDYESFSTSTFDTESTNNVNGTALSFYINLRKMEFDPPEGYSAKELKEFLSHYEDENAAPAVTDGEDVGPDTVVGTVIEPEEDYPNIIVIMNESFSDLSYLGRLRTDTKYMEYFDSLTSKYPNGRLLVSVLGGGTCNTEFEFLTGLSMMNMPSGCYAYMQHITQNVDSMASYLGEHGYDTVAMHPFYEVCWKRNVVYKQMGFDDFISGEDMSSHAGKYVSAERWEKGFGDDVEYIRTLISDSFFYKQVIKRFEEKDDDPLFIFGVTVQNHSTYEYDGEDFETDVHIKRPEGEYPRAEQYLSLIKDSDEALEELISYFEGVDEKTIIVFFGDHQPNVEAELIDELSPYREQFVNAYLTRFETPFMIWSNYDLGLEIDQGVTSANFLGLKTLEAAGIPLNEEYQLIKEAEEVAPAMATWGYFDPYSVWNERQDVYPIEILNYYNDYTYWKLNGKK